jgi:hypothetical protein
MKLIERRLRAAAKKYGYTVTDKFWFVKHDVGYDKSFISFSVLDRNTCWISSAFLTDVQHITKAHDVVIGYCDDSLYAEGLNVCCHDPGVFK